MSTDSEKKPKDGNDLVNAPHPPVTSSPKTSEGSSILVQQQVSHFSGPLPPPEAMIAYKNIQADFPERIFAMAERENTHRHEQEQRAMEANIGDGAAQRRETLCGQIFGFLIAIIAITGAVTIVIITPNSAGATVASVLGGGTLVSLVYAFRYTRKHEAQSEKSPEK